MICEDFSWVDILFLVKMVIVMLDVDGIVCVYFVGYLMGGFMGLMLVSVYLDCVFSFCNIEGNVVLEDCFLSC